MKRPAKSAWSVDARELLAEHVAEDALVETITTTPYIETLTAETVRRREREQTEATRMALRILQREARGESEHAPFRGVLGALRALDEVRMDGAPVRSSSSPSRFEPEHRGASGTAQGDAGQRAVERERPVSLLQQRHAQLAQALGQFGHQLLLVAVVGVAEGKKREGDLP